MTWSRQWSRRCAAALFFATVSNTLPAQAQVVAPPLPAPTQECAPTQAGVVRAANVQLPIEAARAHVFGDVVVIIALDENSNVIAASIRSSPSTLLNAAALDAARHTIFRTETQNCRPVAKQFAFIVRFPEQPVPGTDPCDFQLLAPVHFAVSAASQENFRHEDQGQTAGTIVLQLDADGSAHPIIPSTRDIDAELRRALTDAVAQLRFVRVQGCPASPATLMAGFDVVSGLLPASLSAAPSAPSPAPSHAP